MIIYCPQRHAGSINRLPPHKCVAAYRGLAKSIEWLTVRFHLNQKSPAMSKRQIIDAKPIPAKVTGRSQACRPLKLSAGNRLF